MKHTLNSIYIYTLLIIRIKFLPGGGAQTYLVIRNNQEEGKENRVVITRFGA